MTESIYSKYSNSNKHSIDAISSAKATETGQIELAASDKIKLNENSANSFTNPFFNVTFEKKNQLCQLAQQ